MRYFRTALIYLFSFSFYTVADLSAAEPAPEARIQAAVKKHFPEYKASTIHESQIPGLYQVMLGAEVVYMSPDGRFIIQGDLYDLEKKVNLSEKGREQARIEALLAVPEGEFIEFAPAKPAWTIYVFTDIECSFCRRLHKDIKRHNANGIAVRYLAFPRSGVGSETYRNMVSVWCAPDRQSALTNAKLEKLPKETSCDNPVSRHFELGRDVGVSGTPAIYTEQGEHIGGYLSPDELLEAVKGS